ncbi:PREDICTED: metallophosphoesterase 1-like [Acropora digitifera]|uniref:metallophosphoesterase 1-like n=1 Tax=Acropora digitifera TaxID=70779 RepID=UPI00077A82B0|nr:PREDICTED: metallophosphoesterase 1-like [Acropora digitifera]
MVHNALSFKLRNMRMGNSPLFRQLKWMAILAVCLFLFCEWLIYYLVIFQCSWPDISLQDGKSQFQPLKTMILTDTHLLGPRNGHWFDKLRREWQMERAFQTAISYFKPDVVFLLGDLFDEGMTSNDECRVQQLSFPGLTSVCGTSFCILWKDRKQDQLEGSGDALNSSLLHDRLMRRPSKADHTQIGLSLKVGQGRGTQGRGDVGTKES